MDIPKECRYCGHEVVFTSNKEIYGREYGNGKCYLCRHCGAYVGVHTGSKTPLGTLASSELREWRHKAHESFDRLWKGPIRQSSRYGCYKWLSERMNIPMSQTHIGMFEIDQCKQVIELVKERINE